MTAVKKGSEIEAQSTSNLKKKLTQRDERIIRVLSC